MGRPDSDVHRVAELSAVAPRILRGDNDTADPGVYQGARPVSAVRIGPASFARRPPDLDTAGLIQQHPRYRLLSLGKPGVPQQLKYQLVRLFAF